MNLIPEWMSNVHPLIVHFPIALLVIAVLADFVGLILKRYVWLKPAALWLYVLGALGTVAAYFSGKQAADVVNFPAPSFPVISSHADLALFTMLFFGIYALIRLVLAWKKWERNFVVSIVLFVVAFGGLGLVQQTAERGGELVFRYGVGTKATLEKKQADIKSKPDTINIKIEENGSWAWQAGQKAALQFRQNFKLLKGSWDDLTLRVVKDENNTPALLLQTSKKTAFVLTYGPKLKNVQITAQVKLNNFTGRFFVAHHILNSSTYDFFVIENKDVRLGRLNQGKVSFFDTGTIDDGQKLNLKVVSSSGHYRGYVNDQLLVHGHGSDLAAGQTGLVIFGTGSVQLFNINVVSLDKEAPMMNMETSGMSHDKEQGEHGH